MVVGCGDRDGGGVAGHSHPISPPPLLLLSPSPSPPPLKVCGKSAHLLAVCVLSSRVDFTVRRSVSVTA